MTSFTCVVSTRIINGERKSKKKKKKEEEELFKLREEKVEGRVRGAFIMNSGGNGADREFEADDN